MEREQTTIRLPADLKEQIQRKADEESYKLVTLRLPKQLISALKNYANEKGYTVKDLIVFILEKYLS